MGTIQVMARHEGGSGVSRQPPQDPEQAGAELHYRLSVSLARCTGVHPQPAFLLPTVRNQFFRDVVMTVEVAAPTNTRRPLSS